MPETPPTIFDSFMNSDIFGIPVPILAIIVLVGFVVYLFATRKPKEKEFKPLDMKKEVKKHLQELYKLYGEPVNKRLTSGLIRLGYIKGYMPLMWNKKLDIIQNLRAKKFRKKNNPKNPDETIEMVILKRTSNAFPKKQLSKIFGIFTDYIIVDKEMLRFDESEIFIDSHVSPTSFYGIIIYSKSSRKFLENISFRINRENELQEIANQIPRTVFFDTSLAKSVAIKREIAEIERMKYRGQIESGEEA